MSLVFQDPPSNGGGNLSERFRERSPERKELDDLLTQLSQYPDQWARLYDFPEDAKGEAEKKAGKARSAAGYLNTGKSWSVTVKPMPHGYSVFAKMSSQPVKPRKKAEPKPEDQPDQPEPVQPGQPGQPEPQPQHDSYAEQREPTFQ